MKGNNNTPKYSIVGVSTFGNANVVTDGTFIGGTGTSDDPVTLLSVSTDGTSIIGDGVNNPLQAVTNPSGKGLISGGAIWTGTGFVFDVSDLYYYIDGTYYTSTATQVTLAASDPTNDRFDVIVVDDSGTVSVVTGTPGNPPNVPELAWNEVGVTIVLVEAASTTPTITQDLMYNENAGSPTEWVASTFSLTGAVGTINNASTDNPFNGAVCIKATGVNIRRGSLLTRGTDINIQNFSTIQFAFRLDSAITTSQNFNIRFRNSGGTFIGNAVNIFNWGASRTVIGTNQVVVIPITAFGNITNVRSFVGIMAGGSTALTYNWALDFIKLTDSIPFQQNLGPIYLSATNTLYSSGAATGATGRDNSIFFGNQSGFQATAADRSIFLGQRSGYGATNANDSQFIGVNAGLGASSAASATFIGTNAGYAAINALQSVFLGREAGYQATNASDSFFLGYQAGYQATTANSSAFIGYQAGYQATDATGAVFIGYQAGYGAADAVGSVFIGQEAGDGATNTAPSIAIGVSATPASYNNSIALGTAATNTANNQMVIGNGSFLINQLIINGTGAIQVPVGTTGERIATQGAIRYNTTTNKFEGYDGTTWQNFY